MGERPNNRNQHGNMLFRPLIVTLKLPRRINRARYFQDMNAIGASDWTTYSSVPELTSGLLLLLGMAGLALRRRRA